MSVCVDTTPASSEQKKNYWIKKLSISTSTTTTTTSTSCTHKAIYKQIHQIHNGFLAHTTVTRLRKTSTKCKHVTNDKKKMNKLQTRLCRAAWSHNDLVGSRARKSFSNNSIQCTNPVGVRSK